MENILKRIVLPSLIILLLASLVAAYAKGQSEESEAQLRLKQINLVSSVENYTKTTDEKLTDAWGLEFGHKGRIWLNASSGFSTVYDGAGNIVMTKDLNGQAVPLAVQIPTPPSITDEPAPLTGMVFSDGDNFSGDSFVFVTEQGTIAGWHKLADGFEPLQATMRVDNSEKGSVYKGVTSAKTTQGWLLFAADFANNKIDVFNEKYEEIKVSGGFKDTSIPKDYAPFNIKEIGGKLYVTYAKQSIDKQNDSHGLGNGYINIFDTEGKFIKRFAENGMLNSPWGLALAPKDFGPLSNYLIVGNFGDGRINVFDNESGDFVGTIKDESGHTLEIDKLWALTFGTDNGAGKHNELFFAAGPSAEDQGLFGKLVLN